MAYVPNEPRVQETSTTPGTGTYTLGGSVAGFQTFAIVGDGGTCPYYAFSVDGGGVPDGDWEEGIGTYTVAGTTLARTSIVRSSNANAAVNWAAGTRRIILSEPSSGSGLILLQQRTASASTSLDFAAAIIARYSEYLIEFENIIPATDAIDLWMRMSTNGGSSYDSGNNYSYESWLWRAAATGQSGATAQAQILISNGATLSNSASWGLTGSARLYSPASASLFKQLNGQMGFFTSASLRVGTTLHATYESATAVNAFQFLMSSGNITSGTIRVYGVAK